MSEAQLARIGWFLLAVLEWEPTTPTSPPTPLLKEERGEGRKRRKVARGVVS